MRSLYSSALPSSDGLQPKEVGGLFIPFWTSRTPGRARANIVAERTIGIAIRLGAMATRVEAIAIRNKENTRGKKVLYSSKKPLLAPGITTSSKKKLV